MRVFPCQGSHTFHVDKHISETCNVTTAQLPAKKCILQKQHAERSINYYNYVSLRH